MSKEIEIDDKDVHDFTKPIWGHAINMYTSTGKGKLNIIGVGEGIKENQYLLLENDQDKTSLWKVDKVSYETNPSDMFKISLNFVTGVEEILDDWISVKDELPENNTSVDCKYEGVYALRENVLFWQDGVNNHFGWVNEPDGKGSQPATHWKAATLPKPIYPNPQPSVMIDNSQLPN